jgi:hypothetical protein
MGKIPVVLVAVKYGVFWIPAKSFATTMLICYPYG